MTPQRGHSFLCPAIAVSGQQSISIEHAGNCEVMRSFLTVRPSAAARPRASEFKDVSRRDSPFQ